MNSPHYEPPLEASPFAIVASAGVAVTFRICNRCGALVSDVLLHDGHHEHLAAYPSSVGPAPP